MISSHEFRLSALVVILTLSSTLVTNSDSTSESRNEPNTKPQTIPCPKTWITLDNKCYKFATAFKHYLNAKSRCSDLSSQLALIEEADPSKEEETSEDGTMNLTAYLSSDQKKPDIYPKPYYVNISEQLFNQFLERKRNGNYDKNNSGDDGESLMSDLWIPRGDPSIANLITNISSLPESEIGFVLTYSDKYHKWGLAPVSASRKLTFICEMIRNVLNPITNASPSSAVAHATQNLEPRRSSDTNNQDNPTNHRSSNSNTNEPPQVSAVEKESIATSNQPEVSSLLFREQPQDLFVVLGSTAEIRCTAIDSESTVIWTFNSKPLNTHNRIKIQQSGNLKLEHVRNGDAGNYTCTINSGGVSESRSARLEIIQRPLAPEYITAELLDKMSTSVRIKWTPGFNGNSPITKYLLEMKTVGGDNSDSETGSIGSVSSWEIARANISADQTSVIIPDLKPAKKYIFRIKATNRVGTGDPSTPTNPPVEVPVQPPSMPPENLIGSPKSSTSIVLQWSPPPADSQNGIIKSYKIRHKLAGYATDTEWLTNNVPDASHLSFVIEDLIVWQNYEIQIAAENDKGAGPFSPSIQVRTKEGKPDKAPRTVASQPLSSSVIKVNWNPPPPQHINGINQGYRVQVWSDMQTSQLIKEVTVNHNSVTPDQLTTIDGLMPYTEYFVTVRCYTNAGDGPPNDPPSRVRTKEDLPEAVPILEFSDVLDKSLRLIWKPPIRVNGELDHYTVEYSESSSMDKKILKKFPADTTETQITDLQPKTPYTFKIFPHTNVGQGPGKTNSTSTSVPPVHPEPPSDLTFSNIGPNYVTINFKPGFNGNAGIEKWIVEAISPSRAEVPNRWHQIYTSTNHSHNGNSVVVRNLQPHTKYRLRLTPVNVVGPSRYPSDPSKEFQTSQMEPEQPPRDLSIEDVRSNSASAHWSPLSNNMWLGNPKGYNLTWFESNNSTIMHHLINDTRADSYLVRDLEEFTEYSFRIYAVNEAGHSPPSETITITTSEDVPSHGPTNLTIHALSPSSVSVDWGQIPKRHRNGIIRGYKIQYQAVKPSDAPLQHKTIADNTSRHVVLTDLKPFTTYKLAIQGFTSAGEGVFSNAMDVQTLEDTPGKPQNLTFPTVSQTSVLVLWDPPEDPNGDILGYKVSWQQAMPEGGKEITSHELHANDRTFKAINLKPDTPYVFTVTAKTKEGWGQQNSQILYTYDSHLRANLPFFRESWFVILCACLSALITIIITALLFIQTKSYKYKQSAMKSSSQDRLGDAGFTIDDDINNHYNNGFGLLSQGGQHRRSNGAISQNTANFTLPKTPPRPHPGSVVYSDEGDDDVFEDLPEKQQAKSVAGTSMYDSSGDSLTEKPSEVGSSTAPESESADDEYVNMANKHFVNHYANINGTLRGQKVWKKHAKYYSNSTNPKLPQRPVPIVPQVPGDPSSSSSETPGGQPVAGSSGLRPTRQSNGVYGESRKNTATLSVDQLDSNNNNNNIDNGNPDLNTQQNDLLNSHMVNLNGGRIIVDNMAGSRAPLPGFTSFL